MLEPIQNSNQAFWIRNLVEWTAGIEKDLKIEHVIVKSIRSDKGTVGILYGECYRFHAFPEFWEMASSQKKLSEVVQKWAKLKNELLQ